MHAMVVPFTCASTCASWSRDVMDERFITCQVSQADDGETIYAKVRHGHCALLVNKECATLLVVSIREGTKAKHQ